MIGIPVHQTHGGKMWIITKADQSVTALLLPEEYKATRCGASPLTPPVDVFSMKRGI
jgi:hypothetical protein